ncbi:hypothetical protein H6F47_09680 [Sphaerospermopsis sp. FACHB-1094]|nr:hypothetical protein [Sphaerospermopsis sp. FACHB-1094]
MISDWGNEEDKELSSREQGEKYLSPAPRPRPLTGVGFLHCREGKTWMTWKDSGQGRKTVQNQMLLVTKKVRQNTVVRIKSSLSTFPPCLPGPAQK